LFYPQKLGFDGKNKVKIEEFMAIQISKPTSPGRRFVVKVSNADLHKGKPYAPLVVTKNKTGGRNNSGKITCRHIGGGAKQRYRIIDFKRDKDGIEGRIERIEYDPNRTSFIALVLYADGERRYIVAPNGLKADDSIISGANSPIKAGNCLPISNIPIGSTIHCVEMKPGKGAQLARSAGTSVQLVARDGVYATLRLRSGEMRKVLSECRAVIGEVSNTEHNLRSLGNAGARRRRGVRPTVRGVAMNPIDHPHGGGEGKTSGGRHPVSPWGKPTKGYKTRKNKRTDKYIVRDRRA
jgi:large subunit ribosomal protein L2